MAIDSVRLKELQEKIKKLPAENAWLKRQLRRNGQRKKTTRSRTSHRVKGQRKLMTLMEKLAHITIDGPEDFSIHHDLYISGEKRVETNPD